MDAGGSCPGNRAVTGSTFTAALGLPCGHLLLFALYAITLGRARLNQAPNAVALLALSLAVVSGKLMNEDWLRTGQLHHVVYDLHLLAWLLIAITVVWHLAGVFRRGGVALARSMFRLELRGHDRPRHWPSQWSNWFQRSRHR